MKRMITLKWDYVPYMSIFKAFLRFPKFSQVFLPQQDRIKMSNKSLAQKHLI